MNGFAGALRRLGAWARVIWSKATGRNARQAVINSHSADDGTPGRVDRRTLFMRLAAAPVVGGLLYPLVRGGGSPLHAQGEAVRLDEIDGLSGATPVRYEFEGLQDAFDRLEGRIPSAAIKDVTISRLIMGGNMIGGWAHSRDLIYVASLVQAYNTDDKVFRALAIAEEAGVNTLLSHYSHLDVMRRYWEQGGKMQFIADINPFSGDDMMEVIKRSADAGASMIYVNGGQADMMVAHGQMDTIGEAVELIRSRGVPGGIGAHDLNTVRRCVEHGLDPDFWMKTFHKSSYWSYTPQYEHDNVWDLDPEATAAYMEGLEQPWIAFKILAAGAVPPDQAFQWAFEKGADFICVGMFDWQVVDNVNLASRILRRPIERTRPWRAQLV